LDTDAKRARDRAEAAFKKKEQQLREGQQAMAEYEAARAATREKTARLRALRLAREVGLKTLFRPPKSSRLNRIRATIHSPP
jgi:Tfp pilus assembly protein PilX